MKNFVWLLVAYQAVSMAGTITVTCGDADVDNGVGTSSVITCPQFDNALGVYQGAWLHTLSSVTQVFGEGGVPVFGQVSMIYSAVGFTFPHAATPTVFANELLYSDLAASPADGSAFGVTFTSTPLLGQVGQATGAVSVEYFFEATAPADVPEPATLELVGLTVAALAAKRRLLVRHAASATF